ncbi:MAG: protein translocase subunit SecD [Chloroflexota bacterium]
MTRRPYVMLVLILVLIAFALWIDLSSQVTILNPFNQQSIVDRNVAIRLGLDLRGGLQTLLEADLPADVTVSSDDLNIARQILENRSNALGVSEVLMQVAPPRRIVAEFPGINNPEEVVASLQKTGLLEFVDLGDERLPEGTIIQTDFGTGTTVSATNTPDTSITPTAEATVPTDVAPTEVPSDVAPTEVPSDNAPIIYHTIMTGTALDTVTVTQGTVGQYQIAFTLKSDSKQLFADFTGTHVNQILAIVLDKTVISAPSIDSAITDGAGVITGSFTLEGANALAIQLRYGSLPIPIKVVESRTVGPTLGQESVQKSLFAGIIGFLVIILFMVLYYRLPGALAGMALMVYALSTLMLFKLIPVVLTLPGIAGFILSIGMAVDANILIFERLKEELRAGRTLHQAIDLGWSRAWPSIRDSNFATLITCGILFWFGNAFGASLVKGFSLTLALGVLVSLFTAISVTRTFLHVVLDNIKITEHPRWFGL